MISTITNLENIVYPFINTPTHDEAATLPAAIKKGKSLNSCLFSVFKH
jgi:hypothetical protein